MVLPAPVAPTKATFAGIRVQRDIVKNVLPFLVGKIDIVHCDGTLDLCICDAVVSVGMLPRPHARALRSLGYIAVAVRFRIHEGYISAVLLRLGIHKIEYASRARKRHCDRAYLLRKLCNRLREASRKLKERNYRAECQSADTRDRKRAARNRKYHILKVGHISHDRHEDIRVFVRGESVFVKVAVELIEILFGVFLVAEDLNDLLSAIISSIYPLTAPSEVCCFMKYFPLEAAMFFVEKIISATVTIAIRVRIGLSEIIAQNTVTRVIRDENVWIRLCEIICLSVSVSFVYRLIISPCALVSKYLIGRCCIFFRTFRL